MLYNERYFLYSYYCICLSFLFEIRINFRLYRFYNGEKFKDFLPL